VNVRAGDVVYAVLVLHQLRLGEDRQGYMGNRDGLETAVELFVRRVQAVQFSWPTSGTGDEKRDVLCMCMLEVRK